MKELKECPIHGLTEFTFYKTSSHNGQFKCNKCEVELSTLKRHRKELKK